jgi:hypothetical protein
MLRNDVYLCIINTFVANVKSVAEVLTLHRAGEKNQPKLNEYSQKHIKAL